MSFHDEDSHYTLYPGNPDYTADVYDFDARAINSLESAGTDCKLAQKIEFKTHLWRKYGEHKADYIIKVNDSLTGYLLYKTNVYGHVDMQTATDAAIEGDLTAYRQFYYSKQNSRLLSKCTWKEFENYINILSGEIKI